MKASFLLLLTSLITVPSYSQLDTSIVVDSKLCSFLSSSQDSTSGTQARSYGPEKWWFFSRENIGYKAHNIPLSPVELEIMDLESRECVAVKKRDTLSLMRLWARDFTQDKRPNELVSNKHGLPNYLSLDRMIETFYVIDNNTVFTSGYESFREIKNDWQIGLLAERKYSHTWTKKNGVWKLTTKLIH
jgi:hypothetical protein